MKLKELIDLCPECQKIYFYSNNNGEFVARFRNELQKYESVEITGICSKMRTLNEDDVATSILRVFGDGNQIKEINSK